MHCKNKVRVLLSSIFVALFVTSCNFGNTSTPSAVTPVASMLPESSSVAASQAEVSAAPISAQSKPAPALALHLSQSTVKAGDIVYLYIENATSDQKPRSTTNFGVVPAFYPYEQGQFAFVGIPRTALPGKYEIKVDCDAFSQTLTLEIQDAKFKQESFEMQQGVVDSTVNNAAANTEFTSTVNPIKKSADEIKYWDGKFAMPIVQPVERISSQFGHTRIVNSKISDMHSGIDFPAPAETPVTAPNKGKVQFAGFLQLTGNTVIVEHGFGLKSWYYHMNSIACEAGDMLETGDAIGGVGTTGFSTGNHLHFGMSINGVYVNPSQFLEQDVLNDLAE